MKLHRSRTAFTRALAALGALAALTATTNPAQAGPTSATNRPNVLLLLDASGSMGWGSSFANCPAWNAAHGLPAWTPLTKNQYMRAALTECAAPNDGIIYTFAQKVLFAAYGFGYANGPDTRLLSPFFSTIPSLELAIDSVPASGLSPITPALRNAGQYIGGTLTDWNTAPDAKTFIVLITDGNPNSGDAFFDYACNGSVRWVLADQPAQGADYLAQNGDMLCGLTGDQNIITYVVAVGGPGEFDPATLQDIAFHGGGGYYEAQNANQLYDALKVALTSILAR